MNCTKSHQSSRKQVLWYSTLPAAYSCFCFVSEFLFLSMACIVLAFLYWNIFESNIEGLWWTSLSVIILQVCESYFHIKGFIVWLHNNYCHYLHLQTLHCNDEIAQEAFISHFTHDVLPFALCMPVGTEDSLQSLFCQMHLSSGLFCDSLFSEFDLKWSSHYDNVNKRKNLWRIY